MPYTIDTIPYDRDDLINALDNIKVLVPKEKIRDFQFWATDIVNCYDFCFARLERAEMERFPGVDND